MVRAGRATSNTAATTVLLGKSSGRETEHVLSYASAAGLRPTQISY